MNWSFILILALFVVVGCVDKERNTSGSIEKVATEIATPTVQYHHDESRYPTFMLSKQSRFEMQAKEENRNSINYLNLDLKSQPHLLIANIPIKGTTYKKE
ncbi:hypothetical protein IC611_11495 [Proteus mirabilis]